MDAELLNSHVRLRIESSQPPEGAAHRALDSMVAPADSHEEARPGTSYIFSIPVQPLVFPCG